MKGDTLQRIGEIAAGLEIGLEQEAQEFALRRQQKTDAMTAVLNAVHDNPTGFDVSLGSDLETSTYLEGFFKNDKAKRISLLPTTVDGHEAYHSIYPSTITGVYILETKWYQYSVSDAMTRPYSLPTRLIGENKKNEYLSNPSLSQQP